MQNPVVISSWQWQSVGILKNYSLWENRLIFISVLRSIQHASFRAMTTQCPHYILTVLCRIDGGSGAVGSISFAVECFDFDLELCHWGDAGVLVGVASCLRVVHCHIPPVESVLLFEGYYISKVGPVVVLGLYWLRMTKQRKFKYCLVINSVM